MPIVRYIGVVSHLRVATVRSPSFLFLDSFEGNANISVTIKSDYAVYKYFMILDQWRYIREEISNADCAMITIE